MSKNIVGTVNKSYCGKSEGVRNYVVLVMESVRIRGEGLELLE